MSVLESALSSVDAALASAAEARNAKASAEAQDRAHRHHQYLSLLVRAKNPKPGDDAKLAELILSLELSTEDARRDSARIAEAEKKIPIIENEEEADAVYAAALKAREQMKDRHKEEMDEANKALSRAGNEARRAGWMKADLATLYREAPEIFAEGLIVLPAAVAKNFANYSPPVVQVNRKQPAVWKEINGRWQEPELGPDGYYLRDQFGAFIYKNKQYPDPLLDDRGKPLLDKHGRFMFASPSPPAANEPEAAPPAVDEQPEADGSTEAASGGIVCAGEAESNANTES
jgi:hypothetical protein